MKNIFSFMLEFSQTVCYNIVVNFAPLQKASQYDELRIEN